MSETNKPQENARINVPATVAQLCRMFAEGSDTTRRTVYQWAPAREREVQEAFFRTFETGYTLPTATLEEIVAHRWIKHLPSEWFHGRMYDDDADFIEARFFFTFTHFASDAQPNVVAKPIKLALAQALRMLAAGRIGTEYLNNVWMARGDAVRQFEEEDVLPYDNRRFESLADHVRRSADDTSDAVRRYRVAAAERERLFVTRWLPGILSAAEWAGIRDVEPALLKDLYADLWAQGYAAYRNVVKNRLSPAYSLDYPQG